MTELVPEEDFLLAEAYVKLRASLPLFMLHDEFLGKGMSFWEGSAS